MDTNNRHGVLAAKLHSTCATKFIHCCTLEYDTLVLSAHCVLA